MIIPFSCKTLWKDRDIFPEDEKIVLTLNYFFIEGSLFDVERSTHDSMDDVSRILRKQGAVAFFTFKLDALIDTEGIGKVKQETLDLIFKGGWMLIFLGAWWDLLLGRSEAWYPSLEAKLRFTKADVALECNQSEELTFEVDGFDSSFDSGEGVIRFILALMP